MRALWCVIVCVVVTAAAFGQDGQVAKKVYDSSQDSVFLVYLNDSAGKPSALGSAFLVAPRVLITNYHVIDGGVPVLAVGPVRVPAKVLRVDKKNDLAVLTVDVDLTSKPLQLSSDVVSPGEQVFAIGNPEGLEKTFSQGLVSGVRKRGERSLLQISSPISHGSSGGPILDTKGEVIGVAVGMLEDGQNLNFAVPVAYVRELLDQKQASKSEISSPTDVSDKIKDIEALLAKRQDDEYSSEPDSPYQQHSQQLLELMKSAVDSSSSNEKLAELACLGTKAWDLSDSGIKAGRKLIRNKPSAENRALFAYVLYDRASTEKFVSDISEKGSTAQTDALAAHKRFLSEAVQQAGEAAREAKGERSLVTKFVLAYAKVQWSEYTDAIAIHSLITTGKPYVCGNDLALVSYRSLINLNDQASRPEDAEKWFRRYASAYQPAAYEWDSEGDRRAKANDSFGAAAAYEKAAAADPDSYGYDYCYAANNRFFQTISDSDAILRDGRKCVEQSVKQTGKEAQQHYKSQLPNVYKYMAQVLEKRGVYPTAMEYIKESLAARPSDPWALSVEADILADTERYSECIAAAQAAISASDGKYPSMHFRLGYCYFESSNWSQAAAAFKLAADGDKTDSVAAFNLGLSLSRQGYTADSRQWFREALNRRPSPEMRQQILDMLK